MHTSIKFYAAAFVLLGVCLASTFASAQQAPTDLALSGTAAVTDAISPAEPSQVVVGGLLGKRYLASEENRLLKIDEDELLDGFRHRPGKMEWVGEHVGKWLHAASLTYAATGDPELKAKLDRVAAGLIATQEADGYMGTYAPGKRFGLEAYANWDVWVHKYDLIGLLTYYQYTHDPASLAACCRIGDLLIATFGPGKKSINSAGTHQGMAATSVLEPMVLLYRATGDMRYLEFAEYIASSLDAADGPHLVSSLLGGKPVYQISDAKAYEMLSNLVGLCELYRVTGKQEYLTSVLNAWKDIEGHRLYITGGGSIGELWHQDDFLPNGVNWCICETCVSVTWMQLNMQLLRLSGEPRFAEELEKTAYNHLLGAQKPSGDDWCYYTALNGAKTYDKFFTCCHSSGPRGVALLPMFVYGATANGVSVNLFTDSKATIEMPGNGKVRLEQKTEYPISGRIALTVTPIGVRKPFDVRLRVPSWSSRIAVAVNGKTARPSSRQSGSVTIRRPWKAGDVLTYDIDMSPRVIPGGRANPGNVAVMYGPLVLSCDEALNPALKKNVVGITSDGGKIDLKLVGSPKDPDGIRFKTAGMAFSDSRAKPVPCSIYLTPFYAAGSSGESAFVWMRPASVLARMPISLLSGPVESRSRIGNVPGSIADENCKGFVVTYDNTKQNEDWYALTLPRPVTARKIVFIQGRLFHDGGWFDTSDGKPRIQVMRTKNGPWTDLCAIDSYPTTSAADHGSLREDQAFSVTFAPISVYGFRVVGKPACGDDPRQNFSSCGGLRAY
jgi:hypothetical protein